MAIVIPYTKQTWTDGAGGGTPVSAARLGVVEEGILDISQAPAVRVFHNANQSTTSGTPFVLAFNSERFDQAGGVASTQHDTVTNNSRLTALYAGIYLVTCRIQWPANATGTRVLQLRSSVAATVIDEARTAPGNATDNFNQQCSAFWSFAVNDYVEAIAVQTSGGALNVTAVAAVSPEFSMVRVA